MRFVNKGGMKLVEKVVEALEKMVKGIRSTLRMMGQDPDGSGGYVHPEIKALVDDAETLEAIRTKLLEGYKNASENFKKQTEGNKKSAAEATDKSSGIKFSKKENYSSRTQNTIEGYLDAVDADFLSFIENTRKGLNQQNSKYYFGKVTDNVAIAIKSLIGFDVANWNVAIEAKNISHILKDHGENGITDKSMSNDNDLARIQFVFENFDSIEKSGSTNAYKERKSNGFNKNAQTVKYEKKVNGVYYVVQAVPNTKAKTLYIVTGYIADKKSIKKEASQFSESEINPASEQTSKNANASASIDSISQGSEDVNNKFSLKDSSPKDAYYGAIIRENSALRSIVNQINSFRPNVDLNSKDISKIAKQILKQTGSSYDRQVLEDRLLAVYDYIHSGSEVGLLDEDYAFNSLRDIARDVVEKSETIDNSLWNENKAARDYLRSVKVYINPEQIQEIENIFGSYQTYRNILFGKMNGLSKNNTEAVRLKDI